MFVALILLSHLLGPFRVNTADAKSVCERESMWPWGCMVCWQPYTDKTQEIPFIPAKFHTCMSMSWPLGNIFDG